jgi:hypothetical protein
MKMPGFTAEASLDGTSEPYQQTRCLVQGDHGDSGVHPAQFPTGTEVLRDPLGLNFPHVFPRLCFKRVCVQRACPPILQGSCVCVRWDWVLRRC